ncbi:MAG: YciI family protein [Archangium sp.]
MKFMMMMHHPGKQPYQMMSWARADIMAHIEFMKTFAEKLRKAGELVTAEGLAHPEAAKIVRAGADKQPITDGVFPESKEFLVGFWIIDVENEQRAYAVAAEASAAPGPGGKPMSIPIELRQVMSAPPT